MKETADPFGISTRLLPGGTPGLPFSPLPMINIDHNEACRTDRMVFGACYHDEKGKRMNPALFIFHPDGTFSVRKRSFVQDLKNFAWALQNFIRVLFRESIAAARRAVKGK